MDYKAKYEEALKRADAAINIAADKDLVKGVATTIFPELAESEDERLLNTIIRGFEAWKGNGNVAFNNTDVDDILAYLKKQKEQKHDDATLYAVASDGSTIPIKQKPAENPFDANETMKMKDRIDEGFTKMMMQEQKPAEWNDADMREARQNLIVCCRDWERGENTTLLPIVATRARYFLEHLTEPKPAEWSEEDEKNCNRIIRFLEPHKTFFPTKETKEEMQNWLKNKLKSLRPQPKQKWSKEDEEMLNKLINRLNTVQLLARTDSTSPNFSFFQEIGWLKFLRNALFGSPARSN